MRSCIIKLYIYGEKNRTPKGPRLSCNRQSTDSGCSQCNRGGLSSSQVEGEVVSVALVHNFHTQTSAVENVCPGVEHTTLTIKDGLVEVETVQVERHRGDTKCGEPDTNNSHAARKKCKERELLKEAYWKIKRPK